MVKKLSADFLSTVLQQAAWETLSEDFLWTEQLLEKHRDKVNWKYVSSNSNMLWTNAMLEKFKGYIDWKELSKTRNEAVFTDENLSKFQEYWDWHELSSSIEPSSLETLDKFVDKWDWAEIIDNYSLEDFFNKDFLEKYQDYIPASSLQQSRLWRCLENEEAARIRELIIL